jgi:DNA relaxase NicK
LGHCQLDWNVTEVFVILDRKKLNIYEEGSVENDDCDNLDNEISNRFEMNLKNRKVPIDIFLNLQIFMQLSDI